MSAKEKTMSEKQTVEACNPLPQPTGSTKFVEGDKCPECFGCLIWTENEDYEGDDLKCNLCGHIVI